MFFNGDENGRYSVLVNDEITGGDECLRTNDLERATSCFESYVDGQYVINVLLLDLIDNKTLRTWTVDPDRTPDSALARCPH